MVTRPASNRACRGAALLAELLVAMMLLLSALVPLSLSISCEKRLARSCYDRAVAMEIVDGEMEILMAGEWRTFAPGTHEYPVRGGAVTNALSGQLSLTIQSNWVRLEWRPAEKHRGGPVVREARAR